MRKIVEISTASRDRNGTKKLLSKPRPKCKMLIFMAAKKREEDVSNPSPATDERKR